MFQTTNQTSITHVLHGRYESNLTYVDPLLLFIFVHHFIGAIEKAQYQPMTSQTQICLYLYGTRFSNSNFLWVTHFM